jgi:hypothetical protein
MHRILSWMGREISMKHLLVVAFVAVALLGLGVPSELFLAETPSDWGDSVPDFSDAPPLELPVTGVVLLFLLTLLVRHGSVVEPALCVVSAKLLPVAAPRSPPC